MKKLLLLLTLSLSATLGGEIFADGTSSSFRVQSDQLVASGSVSTSDSFMVQTKTIQVGNQSSAPSFKVYNAEKKPTTDNSGGNNGGVTPPTTGGNNSNSGSGGGGGGRRTYNPQAILDGKYTTDKGFRYESKVTEESKKSDNFYFAQKSHELSFGNNENPSTATPNTNKTTTKQNKAEPTKSTQTKTNQTAKSIDKNTNETVTANQPNADVVKINLDIAPKKSREDYWLTFFEESQEFEESSQKILAQSDDVFYEAAPKNKDNKSDNCWIWVLIAFLVGVITGASCEHFRFIQEHSQNLWQKIKSFALKIWKT